MFRNQGAAARALNGCRTGAAAKAQRAALFFAMHSRQGRQPRLYAIECPVTLPVSNNVQGGCNSRVSKSACADSEHIE